VGAIEQQQKLLATATEEKTSLEEELTNIKTRNSSTIQELSERI